MDYIKKMSEYVGKKVDSLTYMGIEGKKPKNYPISPLIDINWKEILRLELLVQVMEMRFLCLVAIEPLVF